MLRKPGTLRIIAGRYKGRILHLPKKSHVRPTGDRIRETLFNWLQDDIQNAHVLDLFGGSGALGFEALSRGAQHVTICDKDNNVIEKLHENAKNLRAQNLTITESHFPDHPPDFKSAFDIIFIDPPFNEELVAPTIKWLLSHKLTHGNTLVYLETELHFDVSIIPKTWVCLHEKRGGNVHFALYQCLT